MMEKTVALTHGRFTIRAAKLNKIPTARAFLTNGAQGTVAEATGTDVETAIAKLKQILEDTATENVGARRHVDALDFDVPTHRDFTDALSVVKPRAGQLAMLRAHAVAGSEGLTAEELAYTAGYAGARSANLQYAKLARSMAAAIGCDLPRQVIDADTDIATGVLAASGPLRSDGHATWVIHPELQAAVLEAIVPHEE